MWPTTIRQPDMLRQMIEQKPSHAEMPHVSYLYSVMREVHGAGSTSEDSSSSLATPTLQEVADGAPSEVEGRSASTELKLLQSVLSLPSGKVTIPTTPVSSYSEASDLSLPKTASRRTSSLDSMRASKQSLDIHSRHDSLSIRASDSEDEDPFHNIDGRASLMAALKDIPRWEDLSYRSLDSSSGQQLSGDIEGFVNPLSPIGYNFAIQEEEQEEQEEQDEQDEQDEQEKQELQSNTIMSSDLSTRYSESSSLLSLPSLTEKFPVKAKEVLGLYELEMAKTFSLFEHQVKEARSSSSEAGSGGLDFISEVIEDFLAHLFDQLLSRNEQLSVPFQGLLDKEKLHQTIVSMHWKLKAERSLNVWLHGQAAEYCVRKKQFSYVRESQDSDLMNYERYYSSLAQLDRLLLTEKETISKVRSLSAKLAKQLECERIANEQKLKDLEETMRSTLLVNESYTHIAETLEKILADMEKLRNKLSQQRIKLYYIQHSLADMHLKSEQLQNMPKGLNISVYLSQLATINSLEIKILERASEMNRQRHINTSTMHALAHLMCKERMYQQRYKGLLNKLRSLQSSRENYRELLHQGNLKHSKLQREINRLRCSGTMLHYPLLMKDYDEIVTKVDIKRVAVAKLREQYSRLTHQLESAESTSLKADQVEGHETVSNRPSFFVTGVSMHSLAPVGSEQ